MMVMQFLYACCIGLSSSRWIEKACGKSSDFRVFTENQQLDHSQFTEFRRNNLDALTGLFAQEPRICQKLRLVKLGHVALDGSKVSAMPTSTSGMHARGFGSGNDGKRY